MIRAKTLNANNLIINLNFILNNYKIIANICKLFVIYNGLHLILRIWADF